MGYRLGTTSRKNLERITPPLKRIVEEAIKITKQDFTVYAGARTAEEQNALYKQGRTTAGDIVTFKDGYKNKSNHQIWADGFGRAVDLVPYVAGRGPVWDWELIWPIARAMSICAEEAGYSHIIKWGGNWYQTMDKYGSSIDDLKGAVEWYKKAHPGRDHIDGPHYEFIV